MANFEIYDFLSSDVVAADSTADIQDSTMPEIKTATELGGKNIVIHTADDESEERINLGSGNPIVYCNVTWPTAQTESQTGELTNFYYSTSIANTKHRTFRFTHPKDLHTYTTRFDSDLSRSIQPGSIYSIPSAKLKILGRAT